MNCMPSLRSSVIKSASGMILSVALLSGCSGHTPKRAQVQPVSGAFTAGGKPAAKAIVYFVPREPIELLENRPLAVVAPDGTFIPSTYSPGDGLPIGRYAVVASWPTVILNELQEE